MKNANEMTEQEYFEFLKYRTESKPSITFKEFFSINGGDSSQLPLEHDIANFIGGSICESTKHGRGKLKAIGHRLNYEQHWQTRYKEAIENGSIPTVEFQIELNPNREQDLAYARIRHKRAKRQNDKS